MKSINFTSTSLIIGILLSVATQPTPLKGFSGPASKTGAFLPASQAYNSSRITSDTTSTDQPVAPYPALITVNMFNAGNYLMLECELNGKSAYFMVDTGASFTVLHSKFAKLYNFQVLERKGQQTTGFGGNQFSVKIAIGANLNIGNRNISMGFLAQDLAKMIRFIHQHSNVSIAGIIGTDLLKRLGCSVDLGGKALKLPVDKPQM